VSAGPCARRNVVDGALAIVEGIFHGPPLTSRRGHVIWAGMVFLYWSLAFVVGAAIPQVQTISGLVAAVCIMQVRTSVLNRGPTLTRLQFTYTFPPLLVWGYLRKRGQLAGAEPLRLKHKLFEWANFLLFLASAAMACLGMYGSGTAIKLTFQSAVATSFGCTPPV
jgi:hypothetical protein